MATTVEPTKMTDPIPTPIAVAAGEAPLLTPAALKRLGIALGAVAVIAMGAWIAISSGKRKEAFAATQLTKAREAAEGGNLAVASSEFQKVIDTYGGTAAASEAAIAMNQLRLSNGQSALAIDELKKFVAGTQEPTFKAAGYGLLAAALENTGKPAEAAEAYAQAATTAPADYLKGEYLLGRGRALRLAGKSDEAAAVYREIVEKLKGAPSETEAQVRLAELTKGKM